MILKLPIKPSSRRDSDLQQLVISPAQAEQVRTELLEGKKDFGPLGIGIKVGEAAWISPLFARKDGSYMLPIKKDVLDREKIAPGELVTVELSARHKRSA